jgi:methionyl-tRNA formyltransferase
MVNLHFSLLPRWRGAAPVERALLAGDAETGVCLMAVEEGLDTGPVFDTVRVPMAPGITAQELREQLVRVGTEQLVGALSVPLGEPTPQAGEVTYAAKVQPSELRIDWGRPAESIDRLVRLGGAWTTFRGKRIKVLAAQPDTEHVDAALSTDGLRLITVQPEGRGPMSFADFIRGVRPQPGESFE